MHPVFRILICNGAPCNTVPRPITTFFYNKKKERRQIINHKLFNLSLFLPGQWLSRMKRETRKYTQHDEYFFW